jgi:hypothetical protein
MSRSEVNSIWSLPWLIALWVLTLGATLLVTITTALYSFWINDAAADDYSGFGRQSYVKST